MKPKSALFFARQFQTFPQALLAGLPGILVSAAAGYAPARTATEMECRLPESINFQPLRQLVQLLIKKRANRAAPGGFSGDKREATP